MKLREMTAAQTMRLAADELADWQIVDWYEGHRYMTLDHREAYANSGPILRRPDGRLYRISSLGRLVPLRNRWKRDEP